MDDLVETGGGFTLLDGAALVLGAAVASVHIREAAPRSLTALGWGLVWLTFAGVAVTTAGPFVLLERRYGRRPAGYPRVGDLLWCLLGVPWLVTAMLRPSASGPPMANRAGQFDLYRIILWLGIGAASLVALVTVWRTWVAVAPERVAAESKASRWTDRLGTILAICWPLQCGFGLVVAE